VLVYRNGSLLPQEEAAVSVFDSGLNFGDGVFEGIRVYSGRIFRLEQHVDRLFQSARAFDIDIGLSSNELCAEILRWLRANEIEDGFHFRPIVTRGNRFPPRLDPRFCVTGPTVIFVGGPIEPASLAGLRLLVSSVKRVSPEALDPRVKSLNYGNNLLARLDALRRGFDDALMLDQAGFVSEASAANVFIVQGGSLLTPFTRSCLSGITRQAVIELAKAHELAVAESDLTALDVLAADEVFLTATGMEIVPVADVDGRQIGTGAAGPITRQLAEAYARLVRNEGVPIHEHPLSPRA
jgi:branched-chain amino acid aminotransferase